MPLIIIDACLPCCGVLAEVDVRSNPVAHRQCVTMRRALSSRAVAIIGYYSCCTCTGIPYSNWVVTLACGILDPKYSVAILDSESAAACSIKCGSVDVKVIGRRPFSLNSIGYSSSETRLSSLPRTALTGIGAVA